MKVKIKKIVWIIGIMTGALFLLSCTGNNKVQEVREKEAIQLNLGAVIENDNGTYHNYNLQHGKYEKLSNEEVILVYNNSSGNYIAQRDDKYIGVFNGKEIDLSMITNMDENLSISPNGKYISFLTDNEGYEFNIINTENGEKVEFKSEVLISGKLIDWTYDENLIYYGINVEENKNGIFMYDIEDKSEKLVYEFKNGTAQFLKGTQEGIVFVQEQLNSDKILRQIDLKTSENRIISKDIMLVYQLVQSKGDIYVLGRFKDHNVSIYKISNNKVKKMIYDYPSSIKIEKGLSLDEEGNILFVGTNGDANKEYVFKCANDGALSVVSDKDSDYYFVK